MLVVETIAKIRRAYFVQDKSIKRICRELRVSRNTVHKVIRSDATEFSYDRTVQPRPQIDPSRSTLDDMLADNAKRSKRERLTRVKWHPDLRDKATHRFTIGVAQKSQDPFRPQSLTRLPEFGTPTRTQT